MAPDGFYPDFAGTSKSTFVLAAERLGVIFLGALWQRHEQAITSRLRAVLPVPPRELVESRR